MFGIKTHIQKKYNYLLSEFNQKFPNRGILSGRIKKRLLSIQKEYSNTDLKNNLGWLYSSPHPLGVWAYRIFLNRNPNHLGNWSTQDSHPIGTQQLEREVILMLIDLYGGKKENLEGYVTSGGTEGNLFSLWTGKKYLMQQINNKPICLIRTNLTHYSIRKSADITGIQEFITPLNNSMWNMDPKGLHHTIQKLYQKGFRGFLIPLTYGYTQTGTSDDADAITLILNKLSHKYPDIRFFVWMDAALNGLFIPFLDKSFAPFKNPHIQTFIVDFHKFGGVPFPAGVILYRKKLRTYIEKPVEYLPEKDSTVLGSRPGAPVASIWTMIHSLGREGYLRIIDDQQKNKNYFIDAISKISPKIEIVTHPYSLSCGLIFQTFKNKRLPQWLEKKYGLYPSKSRFIFYPKNERDVLIYKCFFLPHMKLTVVKRIINIIKKISTY